MRKNTLGLLLLLAVLLTIIVLPSILPGCAPLGCGCTCVSGGEEGTTEPTTNIWAVLGPGVVILLVCTSLAYYIGRRRR